MMYETKAILRTKWTAQQEKLVAEGWEYHKIENGVVFLRKPFGQTGADRDGAEHHIE